ncbi:hypothetical protein U14_00954 [Candidatus Moduliflexus flocculans]|uniref:Peptidase S55 domain-containing protein n=1 Tax=Candidatus Moduliflexus flocculans TaxID=1499966 RepID=A0A0S6VRD0_9BACT|nr:hypothetical protein U14_00954 [Candidatus Moduliflexus flocculans]
MMKKRDEARSINVRHWLPTRVVTVLCFLVSLGCHAFSYAEPPQLMPIEEIRPGMKGIGKTVFSGTKIEEFNVEILSILTNRSPDNNAIMARVTGGPLPLEKSGVLAGMSGSPIYIDGKLIGALAFIPSIFPNDTIVGITPIHEMLRDAARLDTQTANLRAPQAFGFTPISTPLMVSGMDARGLAFFEQQVAGWNMKPVQGGSVAKMLTKDADLDLQPGSAIGVQLIRGDMDVSGVGTVTYRDGDHIIAFGHPMFWAGAVNFPMAPAYVHLNVSTLIFPFKMASPLDAVGAITQDRKTGISGKMGQVAPMIPFEVTLNAPESNAEPHRYMFEIADYKQLTSLLMKIATLNALLAFDNEQEGEFAITAKTAIEFADTEPFAVENRFVGKDSPIPAVIGAFAPLDALIENKFKPVHVSKVSVEMTVRHATQTAEIIGIAVKKDLFRPGETVDAMLTLQPYNQEAVSLLHTLTIPQETPRGALILFACDADATTMIETMRAQAKYMPQDLEQLTRLLRDAVSRNTLVLSLLDLKPGVVIQGQEFPSPPLSMTAMMASSSHSYAKNSLTRGRILARTYLATDFVMSGCVALPIQIDGQLTETGDDVVVQPMDTIQPIEPKKEGEETE